MGIGSFYYLNGNYGLGIVDHANGMNSSVPWASAGIATDFLSIAQLVGTSGAQAMASTSTGAAAASLGKFAAAAATPIINAGLITLTVASNTLGFGRPEDGERFGRGSEQFGEVGDQLQQTAPPEDWQGDARDAYHERNAEQHARACELATFDEAVQRIIAKEADQVEKTREFVSKRQTILAASIPAAIAAKAIPVAGPAISAGIEIAAVLGTVPFALDRVGDLAGDSQDNADEIGALSSRYESVAADARLPGGGFGTP